MDEHLGHFQVFVTIHNTAVNIPLRLPQPLYIWINGLLEQFKNFIDIAKLTSKYYTSLQSNYQYMRVPVSPYPYQQWGSSSFLITDSLLCEKWISLLLSFPFLQL